MNNKEYKNAASTVSLIVLDGNSIYLIRRKYDPFKGLWSLPGGFLNCDQETLEEAAIRELKEETGLITRDIDLELFCINSSPKRDPRGHVIDHVYRVNKYNGLPESNDDADDIKLFNLNKLPQELAFDHQKVLMKFVLLGLMYGPL
jgi:8-oxo-dGTP diphosphatase